MSPRRSVSLLLFAAAAVTTAYAQTLSGSALVNGLRRGGYVIVMRHASSPREAPEASVANADNPAHERQLDAAGRAATSAMGDALRRLMIPVNEVFASPTYRTRETVRLLGVGTATSVDELGDGGRSMQTTSAAQATWLKTIVTRIPTGNSVIVTHAPNIASAFPDIKDIAEGESLVFRPDGRGGSSLVARLTIDEWARLP